MYKLWRYSPLQVTRRYNSTMRRCDTACSHRCSHPTLLAAAARPRLRADGAAVLRVHLAAVRDRIQISRQNHVPRRTVRDPGDFSLLRTFCSHLRFGMLFVAAAFVVIIAGVNIHSIPCRRGDASSPSPSRGRRRQQGPAGAVLREEQRRARGAADQCAQLRRRGLIESRLETWLTPSVEHRVGVRVPRESNAPHFEPRVLCRLT